MCPPDLREQGGSVRRSLEEQCWLLQVLAAALGSHLLAVGQKSQIRLSRDIKRTICKVGHLLAVGQKSQIRLSRDIKRTICKVGHSVTVDQDCPSQAPTGLDGDKLGCLLAVVQKS